ncbi:hypothetical protein BpHYR1_049590 [Brachionus plicatilis]|uniref:Uncharacterized protein n=1 Tax=Brachionus plicatilis TaxID=10195 RepID=A0A3M7PJQ7_BRAPC|nr:hypothetical protein BpHYR1_049590 [Brachionus plicatilis]
MFNHKGKQRLENVQLKKKKNKIRQNNKQIKIMNHKEQKERKWRRNRFKRYNLFYMDILNLYSVVRFLLKIYKSTAFGDSMLKNQLDKLSMY